MSNIRNAASLMIVAPIPKDGASNGTSNFKVLLLKRNAKSTFVNAHVYPGGVVDKADHYTNWSQSLTEQEGDILTYKICAIRETFEESGLLLCTNANNVPKQELNAWRNRVHDDATQFKVMCEQYKISPDVDRLIPYSNWITPAIEKRRWNTHFFLTVLDQEYTNQKEQDLYFKNVMADGKETVQFDWLKPEEAVEQQKDKKIVLMPPQWYTLVSLLPDYKDLKAKAGIDMFRTTSNEIIKILPQNGASENAQGETIGFLAYPGDETYSSQEYKHVKGGRHRLYFTGFMENYALERNIRVSDIVKTNTSHL